MTEATIIKGEIAEIESFNAACDNGLILGHLGKEDARHVFGLGFRFALGYLRFKDLTKEKDDQ